MGKQEIHIERGTCMNQQETRPQQEETEIDLLELLLYFKQKLWYIIGGFLIGALLAGLITRYMITPQYTASTKLYMVAASSDSVINLTDINLGTSLSNDYAELITIHPIVDTVISDLDLPYTYKELLGMTTIENITNTRIIKITVESPDPEEAKDVANALAQETVKVLPDLMETSEPSIAEEALLPVRPSSPSYTKNIMIGALLGILLVAGILTVFFLMDDTLKSAEDVEKALGIMPLTVIPEGDIASISDKKEKELEKEQRKRRRKKTDGRKEAGV